MKKIFSVFAVLLLSPLANASLQTVPYVDVSRYLGAWYQISRNPLPFEGDCACARQVLDVRADGNVGVWNSCNDKTPSGRLREIRGFATNDDPTTNARFTVDFGFPKKGAYWIIGLDADYRYAVVTDPAQTSLYILSKTPQLDPALYEQAVKEAARQVDTSKLLATEHRGCVYPDLRLQSLPTQPREAQHPGSATYAFTLKKEKVQIQGRQIDVYLPSEAQQKNQKVPVVVFGHGQAIGAEGYEMTFEHLARKGVAVIHPMYDTGFFDQDWNRMANDFNSLTAATIQKYSQVLDPQQVIYAGHSKGGYVALMAMGSNPQIPVKAGLFFSPAGYDINALKRVDPQAPVTVFWADADTIIKQSLVQEIYSGLASNKKQFVKISSYADLKADHFFLLNRSYFFGGKNGVSAFHYHGVWKWLVGAAQDVINGSPTSNAYLYGDESLESGLPGLVHSRVRSW